MLQLEACEGTFAPPGYWSVSRIQVPFDAVFTLRVITKDVCGINSQPLAVLTLLP